MNLWGSAHHVLGPTGKPDTLALQVVPEEPKHRSGRITAPVTRFEPSFTGKKYAETTATTIHKSTIHPDTHMSLNKGQSCYHVVHYTMTQLSMKAGIKRWENKGKQAVSKELSQLHMRDTFRPINSKTLSKTKYDQVLESHLFLKQKRDHSIKGRMAADGNKQRGHIDKTNATSPTSALESVLLTSTIDAKEGRDVDIIDTPNAFVTTRIEEKRT